jgi:hypothetical protein
LAKALPIRDDPAAFFVDTVAAVKAMRAMSATKEKAAADAAVPMKKAPKSTKAKT